MKNKKPFFAVVALVIVVSALLGIYFATRPGTHAGSKEITVTVVYKDGSSKDFVYHTDAEYLGTVIVEEGLAKGEVGPYGLYIHEVDGVRAVWEENGAFWSIYIGEESAVSGADAIPIEDGKIYRLVYTLG